ncbi:maltose alpha-D-glucosyltransferase [Rhodothermaceae bacterium RA]|nr:maltose alpha-D-glucosyltransferase [Rhodothermaceae bacterium RA]
MSSDFLTDPTWYKDAVIYELHVRSFFDANDDGYGDFEGLRRKLPYLASLGINTLWLLPFLESPLRDDGYDIADYFKILPVHGSLDDFRAFLDEAHAHGMRVITELVLNHTSDQHPWFQEARDPASPRHDWYVWSDTTERYADTRIIFTDTEVSNWTWDRKAQKYYWHRFFSHQPDLNYDNPEVRQAMKEVMFFWLDLGVDGLRLDAVPYLYEREGTNCENLPETIAYIKELRAAIEARYGPGKILLAEANQWPEDTLPYFGDGDGVQMAFNFPIMPRMYMALRRENRRPLVEMLELTRDIPEDAQWAIFLRNHDELTLEMVTDEERDYLYHEYANDPRFRINVGIRRRLAPLLGGERKRIELMTALLLSLKGSPVLYYGDEIAMGDDPFLGDRNGVRTPMQWSADRNGGFSRAPHHRLFLPPIARGPYSYEFVNVEDAERDPHSLLNFTKRLLALRRQHVRVFGRGSFTLIPVDNQSVLAFLREYEGRRILVVANLSRFAQSVHLPVLDALQGLVPVELFSQAPFPVLGETPYHLLLGPHNFFWFALKPEDEIDPPAATRPEPVRIRAHRGTPLPELPLEAGLENLLVRTMARQDAMESLERLLPAYLEQQRWFGAKGLGVERVEIADAVRLRARPHPIYLTLLDVTRPGGTDRYVLPLTLAPDAETAGLLDRHPHAAVAWVTTPDGRALLYDATIDPAFWTTLLTWWQEGRHSRSLKGLYVPEADASVATAPADAVRLLSGEQSNSAAVLGERFFAKLYRRLERGPNPEAEMLEYLTEAGFAFSPRLHGTVTFREGEHAYALAVLQQALPMDEDGWTYAQEMTRRFLERIADTRLPETRPDTSGAVPVWLDDVAAEMLSLARILGIRTAELHLALARADTPALRPVACTADDLPTLVQRVQAEADETRRLLDERAADLPGVLPPDARWADALAFLDGLTTRRPPGVKIRVHGDYHLGQIARAQGEFYILDFEGEPARSLHERRRHDHALRDVAGMLRSLEYAALATWQERFDGTPALEPWTNELVRWSMALFLEAYFDTAEEAPFLPPPPDRKALLWIYLFSKALYEIRYELSHRPDWTWLPLRGLDRLLKTEAMDPA